MHDTGAVIQGLAPLRSDPDYCPSTSEPEVTCGTSTDEKAGGSNIYSCMCEGGPLGPGYTPYGLAYPIGNSHLKSIYDSGWWRRGQFEKFSAYKAKAVLVINVASG